MVDKHITEPLVYAVGNRTGINVNFVNTDLNYDVAINGKPFFLANTDERPYRRVTAKYRKDQFDQTAEAGEQTLTGWWIRSQSSFHLGSGIKYYEPSQDETLRFRFADSKGINVWTQGQATLLRNSSATHTITGTINSNGRADQQMRSIQWTTSGNTYQGALLHDEYDIDKVFPEITASVNNKALTSNVATLTTASAHGFCAGMEVTISGVDATFNGTYTISTVPTATTFTYAKTAADVASTAVSPAGTAKSNVIHFVDYNSGTDSPVFGVCDDGTTAYWVTNAIDTDNKLHVYKKSLDVDASTSPTNMFKTNGIVVTNAVIEYVKERLVAGINNSIYEFTTTATALPTALYTHPNTNHVWSSITASGSAIYVAGYTGLQSTIVKFTLETDGGLPTLSGGAATAAEMPPGEIIHKIFYYLGYMMIGTSKGIRAAIVNDNDGSINYGPLIVETTQPCYDFAARDSFVWCATGVDGEPGVIRIDLGNAITPLRFAWANDLYKPGVANFKTTSCAFMGSTDRLGYCTDGNNGSVYVEDSTTLMPSGELTTGRIRYGTLEPKVYKLMRPRIDITNGSVTIDSIDKDSNEFAVTNFAQGAVPGEVGISYPVGGQEFVSFKFTLNRSAEDTSLGPIFNGYQIKGLPATPRQRLIQFPLFCYDQETDSLGNQVGYEDRAYDRILELEAIENIGDTVKVQDFRTDETFIAQIEEVDFMSMTPPGSRFNGFGGILTITLRTV